MESFFDKNDDKLKWSTEDTELLLNTVVFDVTKQHNISENGVSGDYIILNARDWVITIPEKDGKFLMVKQWRHGEKSLSVEFPGGVIDEGEDPAIAAVRELEEETGYKAGKLTKLCSVNPNPALFSNHVHVFLAEDLIPTGIQHLDDDEFINYIEVSVSEVFKGICTKEFPHALMGTAMLAYLQHKKRDIL